MRPSLGHAFYTLVVMSIGVGIAFIFSEGISYVHAKITNTTEETNLEDNPGTDITPSNSDILTPHAIPAIKSGQAIPTKEIKMPTLHHLEKITKGMLMFRGNPERNDYGIGPIPQDLKMAWRYPEKPMCNPSTSLGVTKIWCGTGWTGQPIAWEHNGKTEIIFGGYDGAFHFVDADTGLDVRNPFQTADIIKGSVTLDPDGYPLLYSGSRDNFFRILALEGDTVKELWKLNSNTLGGIWNNDWDSNPLIINDILYEGGENGIFYAIKLHRSYDESGHVTVSPEIVFSYKTYNDDLRKLVGNNVSIENSTLIFNNTAYIANSGGRILGFDISNIEQGIAPIVFDYWVGDDVDATIIADDEGMIYVTAELERWNERSLELGQFIKLDPSKQDPYVWGIKLLPEEEKGAGGAWATPAISGDYIYLPIHNGYLLTINKNTGHISSRESIGFHAWSSPNIVDGELVIATCATPEIRSYSLTEPSEPVLKWSKKVGEGCIESTPTIWKNAIYLGSRDGYFYKVSE